MSVDLPCTRPLLLAAFTHCVVFRVQPRGSFSLLSADADTAEDRSRDRLGRGVTRACGFLSRTSPVSTTARCTGSRSGHLGVRLAASCPLPCVWSPDSPITTPLRTACLGEPPGRLLVREAALALVGGGWAPVGPREHLEASRCFWVCWHVGKVCQMREDKAKLLEVKLVGFDVWFFKKGTRGKALFLAL